MTKKKAGKGLESIEELAKTGQLPRSVSEIGFLCEEALAKTKDIVTTLISLPKKERTFENTIVRVDEIGSTLWGAGSAAYLLKEVHPDAEIRARAERCVLDLEKYSNELMLRREFYDAISQYKPKGLKNQDAKFYKDLMLGFKRSGVTLPKPKRDQLQAIKDELSKLELEFSKNIAEDQTTLAVDEKDIEGFPQAEKAELKRENGKIVLRTDPPTVMNVMQYVKVEETRKKVLFAYNNRAYPANVPLLEKIIEKRHSMAKLLGYKTYAEFQLEDLMAKKVSTARSFLEDLRTRAKKKAKSDYQELIQIKKEVTGEAKPTIHPWDKAFYRNLLKERSYKVDDQEISQYFSAEATVDGLFTISQRLFGLSFKEVDAPWKWHSDVKFYEVYSVKENELIGRFYTDLYPRENKYSHAAKFGIVPARSLPHGGYQVPTVAIVANFPKPTADRPALLKHQDVETFFHEFGHCLHALLTRAKYIEHSGTSVKRDFVEAPSQMFENWVWAAESLNLFAKHYKSGQPLPPNLLDNMLKAKNLMSGIDTQQQIYYADISLSIYSKGPKVDTDQLIKDLHQRNTLFDYFEGTHFQAAFGHLTGYGAGYYGYNWSKVYAEDMFTRFEGKNLLNPKIGMEYREKILAQGSGRDEMKSVVDFLGRKPNSKAFFKSLGF